tara:strand:+ start:221 stop:385 length:165 start_codon:yes stop_codon:yes gene_type:complete
VEGDAEMKKIYMYNFFKIGMMFIVLFITSSCGQKGPLYYPDDKNSSLVDFKDIA